ELHRQQIDNVECGSSDSDWQPAKDAARKIAYAEDRAIFEGYAAAGIGGIRQGTNNPTMTLPADVRQYPVAIAQALNQLRLVGVIGLYPVLLGADAYPALAETSDNGYPVLLPHSCRNCCTADSGSLVPNLWPGRASQGRMLSGRT